MNADVVLEGEQSRDTKDLDPAQRMMIDFEICCVTPVISECFRSLRQPPIAWVRRS